MKNEREFKVYLQICTAFQKGYAVRNQLKLKRYFQFITQCVTNWKGTKQIHHALRDQLEFDTLPLK